MEGGEHYGSQENSKEGRKEDREEGGKEGSKEDREEAPVVFVHSIPKEKQNPIVSTRGFCRSWEEPLGPWYHAWSVIRTNRYLPDQSFRNSNRDSGSRERIFFARSPFCSGLISSHISIGSSGNTEWMECISRRSFSMWAHPSSALVRADAGS